MSRPGQFEWRASFTGNDRDAGYQEDEEEDEYMSASQVSENMRPLLWPPLPYVARFDPLRAHCAGGEHAVRLREDGEGVCG